uniref:Uncharacterized protein n=1 Tax=Rhizophora mucronata TaxID=61149 RepID=A0A2P2NC26_RHIMU
MLMVTFLLQRCICSLVKWFWMN